MREELKNLKIRIPKKFNIELLFEAFKEYIAIKRLLPDEVWKNYELNGIKDLTEIKLMNKAIKNIRLIIYKETKK